MNSIQHRPTCKPEQLGPWKSIVWAAQEEQTSSLPTLSYQSICMNQENTDLGNLKLIQRALLWKHGRL